MRVVIADDEPLALERLTALFAGIGGVEVVGQACDGLEAAALIGAHRPDLAFLDVRMPGRDGMALARALHARTSETEVVFVTAYDQFAAEAFDLDAVDYLLKPVAIERLAAALARARRRRIQEPTIEPVQAGDDAPHASGIWVRRREGLVRIAVAGIDWIEAAGDYVMLHTPSRSYMHRSTMEALRKQLDPAIMVRVSRSAFVRREAVTAVRTLPRGGMVLVVGDQAETPVGQTYLRAARQAFGLGPNASAPR